MTKLLVMLSVAVRRIRRIRVQVLVIFRARGIPFAHYMYILTCVYIMKP